jgi:O-methyltransferase
MLQARSSNLPKTAEKAPGIVSNSGRTGASGPARQSHPRSLLPGSREASAPATEARGLALAQFSACRRGARTAKPTADDILARGMDRSRTRLTKEYLRSVTSRVIKARGYELRRYDPLQHADLSPEHRGLFARVSPYTQTSLERIAGLVDAVEYIVRRGIPGDFVECGVWRGGSSMAMALTLLRLGVHDRRLWLYDTFGSMPPAGEHDRDYAGRVMTGNALAGINNSSNISGLTLPEVRQAISSTGYPAEYVSFVEGLVEDTLPRSRPERIAVLRLDTDWYQSTRCELIHLYPRLERGGVLIVDDYGHFAGARKAVDEYFAENPILLNRMDYTGRIATKL